MAELHPCTFENCDRVFTKAFELRKHTATHEDPDSVFHCPSCDFITLQKKSLAIHIAIHTGEKAHECPDHLVDASSGLPAKRCGYRTNDPAALSKHRKKVHGYVPAPNRSRLNKADIASPRKSRENKDETATRCRRRPQRSTSRRRLPRTINSSNGIPGYMSVSGGPSSLVHQGNPIDVDCYVNNLDGGNLFDSDEEMSLDTPYDPSLRSQWIAEYEAGYSSFDVNGMKYIPEPLRMVSSSSSIPVDGREGCLCPEWMAEAGIPGWN